MDSSILDPYLTVPWIRAGLFILGGGVAALLTRFLFLRVVFRLVRRTESDLDDQVAEILRAPLFYLVWLIGVGLAVRTFSFPQPWHGWSMSVVETLAFLIALAAAGKVARLSLRYGSASRGHFRWLDTGSLPLFENLLKVLLIGGGIYLLLSAWSVDATPWLASAGIAGIAIGFAAKDTLANLFAGLFILADAPYKIGDFIVLEDGSRGSVTRIGLRSTRILTRDDVEVTIPNAVIANSRIVNESGGPSPRFRVTLWVGVSYESDVEKVREVLRQVARDVESVVDEPAPRVRFTRFGESSLDFRLLCWVAHPVERGICLDALHSLTLQRFRQEGIEIPYPQRVLHRAEGFFDPTGAGSRED